MQFNVRGSIILIALGSIIVLVGILLYMTEVFGAIGMIGFGIVIEIFGAISLWKSLKKNRSK